MPRTRLEPQFAIEHLSVLDSDGNLDATLEPDLSAAELKRLYRAMLLGRRLDERMLRLQRQGRIGTFAPIKGQEASQIGSVSTLDADRLDGAVVPRDGGDAVARVADREDPAAVRGLSGGRPARAGPARSPDRDSRRHAAAARRRPRVRGAVQGRRRRRHGVLRRRRHVRGRFPRGAELRRRLARAGRVRVPEQPVGDLGAAQEADALAHHRPEGARLRPPGHPGRRQRPPRGPRRQP